MPESMKRVFSAGPSISQLEIQYATDAIENGWFENRSSYLDRFIAEFSTFSGKRHVLPTSHCTDAIHLALLALGIGPGDEVIVPDLTWVASAAPILYVGATPVFADVDRETWCMSAEDIAQHISPRTKAIIVVDLLGNMPDWDPILELCNSAGIPVIEDAAESIGARYKGKLAGSFGDISVFSFNATKLLMAGQGGALCTNSPEMFESAKRKSHHGIDIQATGKYFWSVELGYNYNWTNVQAAVALAQLERLDDLLGHKRWLNYRYRELLEGIPNLSWNQETDKIFEPTYWVPTIIFNQGIPGGKEGFLEAGFEEGIDFRPMFYQLSSMPTFAEALRATGPSYAANSVSESLSNKGVSLPSGNDLVDEDLQRVAKFVRKSLSGNR